ncbi:MAG: hypothetical protein QOC82_3078 [Frankiaceae bacterium]|jgi:hypothetical protein|nr:hypothetical protein [Frankiaceae bacterium]MDQ1699910.1 hypothetical protein [Frankiaceae bacterium]
MSTPPSGISPTPLDQVRARVAYGLLGIFAGTVLLAFALGPPGQFGTTLIGAELVLLRAVLGFYFTRR